MDLFDNLYSPQNAGLLGLAQGLLSAGGPSRVPVGFGQALGQGFMGGLSAQQAALAQQEKQALMRAQMQHIGFQNASMQGQMEDAARKREGILAFAQQLPENERAAFILSPDTFIKERFAAYTLKPGEQRFVGNNQVAGLPETPKLEQVPVPGQPGITQGMWLRPGETSGPAVGGQKLPEILNPDVMAARLRLAREGKPEVSVNVSTEKKYGEQFAGMMAKSDADLLDSARKAPDLAQRANLIKETLSSGKVITGAGADIRLQLGKALNLVGATDKETLANTETLVSSLAQNTLDAIKASGLGSGTGFSNADRDFLEKAVGGKITLEAATLNRLADLSHRAASKSAEKWNARVKDIPDSALAGTGIQRTPVDLPALFGAPAPAPSTPAGFRIVR